MYIRFNGAHCCGVKTIEGFWSAPESFLYQKSGHSNKVSGFYSSCERYYPKEGQKSQDLDKRGSEVSSRDDMYPYERPRETCLARLKAYIKFLKDARPAGLLDCCLIDSQRIMWHDTLLSLGFVESCRFKNSNSSNYITCYHLVYGQPKTVKTTKKSAPFMAPS